MTSAGRTELIFIIFMMVFLFLFGCAAVFIFIRQYRREKRRTVEADAIKALEPSK
ncbi:MAG: hypothetical protein ABIZ95_18260 [Pyrinomonadaceae bacterium]